VFSYRHTEEHIKLLDAILEQNSKKAHELLEAHLCSSEEEVIRELKRLQRKKKEKLNK